MNLLTLWFSFSSTASNSTFFVDDRLDRRLRSNPLFVRTVDTGSENGRAGLHDIRNVGKMTLDEWQLQHPGLNIEDLPDYSYMEENGIN